VGGLAEFPGALGQTGVKENEGGGGKKDQGGEKAEGQGRTATLEE